MIVKFSAWPFAKAEPIRSPDVNGPKRCIVNQPHSSSKQIADSQAGSGKPAQISERTVSMLGNRLSSSDLFKDSRELTIAHGDELYRLRLTAQNKLILTK
jgi:hemin uptake protein HemP